MADTAHGKLLNNVLAAIYEKYGRDACVQKINVINAKAIGRGGTTRHVRSAQDGTADIVGCICGAPVAIEIKAGKDRQRESQKDWQQAWEKAGGIYIIGKSAEGVLAEIYHIRAVSKAREIASRDLSDPGVND